MLFFSIDRYGYFRSEVMKVKNININLKLLNKALIYIMKQDFQNISVPLHQAQRNFTDLAVTPVHVLTIINMSNVWVKSTFRIRTWCRGRIWRVLKCGGRRYSNLFVQDECSVTNGPVFCRTESSFISKIGHKMSGFEKHEEYIYIHTHYLPISNWTLLILHLL